MMLRAELVSAIALPLGLGLALHGTPEPPSTVEHVPTPVAADVSFAEQVLPIFEARCTECHGNLNAELGLNLSTYEGVMAGSDYGTVIEPGNADASLLIDMVASGDMPEDADPMPEDELELIKTWITEGAQNN